MNKVHRFCFWIVVTAIILFPFEYLAIMSLPDSTDYFLQEVDSSVTGPDGRNYIYVGDNIHIKAYNWRRLPPALFNDGKCLLDVSRVRANVGGKFDGKKTEFQFVQQQFVNDGNIRLTSWPIPPVYVKITDDWFDDPDADEQEMDIWTEGPYDCNIVDHIRKSLGFPRMMHDNHWNPWRHKTRVVLKRHKN